MKKILSLLLASSSMFSMNLQLVPVDNTSMNYGTKSVYTQPKMELGINRFESKKRPINATSVFVPNRLGLVELYHSKKGFSVKQYNENQQIQKHLVDKLVRNMTKEELKSFLKIGYFALNQMDNGEYTLQAIARINGSGPMLGTAMYWVTKSLCYAVGVTAITVGSVGVGTAIVATGGTALAPTAIGVGSIVGATTTTVVATVGTAAGTGAAIATTAGAVAVTAASGGAVAAGTLVGGTVGAIATGVAGGAAIGTVAVEATTAVVATAGVGGTIAGIEAVSLAVGTFFGMLPTP